MYVHYVFYTILAYIIKDFLYVCISVVLVRACNFSFSFSFSNFSSIVLVLVLRLLNYF